MKENLGVCQRSCRWCTPRVVDIPCSQCSHSHMRAVTAGCNEMAKSTTRLPFVPQMRRKHAWNTNVQPLVATRRWCSYCPPLDSPIVPSTSQPVKILLPSAVHLKERLTASQSVSLSGKQSVGQADRQTGRQKHTVWVVSVTHSATSSGKPCVY